MRRTTLSLAMLIALTSAAADDAPLEPTWRRKIPGLNGVKRMVALEGALLAADQGGAVVRLSLPKGDQAWRVALSGAPFGNYLHLLAPDRFVMIEQGLVSMPLGGGPRTYRPNVLYCRATATSAALWDKQVAHGPSLRVGNALFVVAARDVIRFDLSKRGKRSWTRALPAPLVKAAPQRLIAAGARLIVTFADGARTHVACYEMLGGKQRWTLTRPVRSDRLNLLPAGDQLIALERGDKPTLRAFALADKAARWTHAAPAGPTAAIVRRRLLRCGDHLVALGSAAQTVLDAKGKPADPWSLARGQLGSVLRIGAGATVLTGATKGVPWVRLIGEGAGWRTALSGKVSGPLDVAMPTVALASAKWIALRAGGGLLLVDRTTGKARALDVRGRPTSLVAVGDALLVGSTANGPPDPGGLLPIEAWLQRFVLK